MDLAFATATSVLRAMAAGRVTGEQWMAACLERIAARDADVRAWVCHDPVRALAATRDPAGPAGPLRGVPFGVKDVILTRDYPTQYNSPLYEGHHPGVDAGCVTVLRAAGALLVGKTDTVEFAAARRVARTRNPHDLARTPGGSSSGSAAAVADGHVPIALGTQTGGSLIRPASYCGIFAMKPTWGFVGRDGVRLYAASLDTVGWYARGVDDLGLVYDVFDPDPPPAPAATIPIAGARIGLCRTPFWDRAEEGTRAAFRMAEDLLRSAGAQTVEVSLPETFAGLGRDQMVIMRGEGRAAFLPEYRDRYASLNDAFRGMVENEDGFTREDLLAAYDRAAAARPVFDRLAGAFDAILAPSTVGEAPLGLHNTGSADFNGIWTLLHVPCINVPGFSGANRMPIGLSLLAGRFQDRRLLAVAAGVAEVFGRSRPNPIMPGTSGS